MTLKKQLVDCQQKLIKKYIAISRKNKRNETIEAMFEYLIDLFKYMIRLVEEVELRCGDQDA